MKKLYCALLIATFAVSTTSCMDIIKKMWSGESKLSYPEQVAKIAELSPATKDRTFHIPYIALKEVAGETKNCKKILAHCGIFGEFECEWNEKVLFTEEQAKILKKDVLPNLPKEEFKEYGWRGKGFLASLATLFGTALWANFHPSSWQGSTLFGNAVLYSGITGLLGSGIASLKVLFANDEIRVRQRNSKQLDEILQSVSTSK